jgi:hypothetical protein
MSAVALPRVENTHSAQMEPDGSWYNRAKTFVIGGGIGAIVGQACLQSVPPICRKLFSPARAVEVLKLFDLQPTAVSLSRKIVLAITRPVVGLMIPVIEESFFRGILMEGLEKKISEKLTHSFPCSKPSADKVAWVASLALSSLAFGAYHFPNALVKWCNPVQILPQAIFATCFGLAMGILKTEAVQEEILGFCPPEEERMAMPIAAHIGSSAVDTIKQILA